MPDDTESVESRNLNRNNASGLTLAVGEASRLPEADIFSSLYDCADDRDRTE
ncbi:MAG: hypothetical protein WB987_17405 [Candidatus Acidiferrales bacterium]